MSRENPTARGRFFEGKTEFDGCQAKIQDVVARGQKSAWNGGMGLAV
jgi:hypothetical protein